MLFTISDLSTIFFPRRSQALQAAHLAGALQPGYLLDWMKQISTDLIKLEADAAPDGWKCSWNRYVWVDLCRAFGERASFAVCVCVCVAAVCRNT